MKYQIEIFTKKEGDWDWRPVKPSFGEPYTFNTYDEAYNFADWLYYNHEYGQDVRVTELKEETQAQPFTIERKLDPYSTADA